MTTSHVLSVLIESLDRPGMVLLGIRRRATNFRHPGVLSTPTQRLPQVLFSACAEGCGIERPGDFMDGRFAIAEDVAVKPLGGGGVSDAIVYAVSHLMCRKLGMADALESNLVAGHLRRLGIAAELVADPQGTGLAERTIMLTVGVMLESGASLVPSQTAAYSTLAWARKNEIGSAVRTKDALVLVPDADPFEVCLDGLCVRSASQFLL
jgi:hypothetical protein